jgi:hypothetical protein
MKSKKSLTCFITLIVAVFGFQGMVVLATDKPSTKQATEFRVNNKVLKTKPARLREIAPLIEALVAFDTEIDRNNDHPPKDARKRLQKINDLAPKAKAEILLLADRSKQASEVEEFNAFVAAKVKESQSERWASELNSAGGDAYAILVNSTNVIDRLIADRTELTDKQARNMSSGRWSAKTSVSHWVDTTALEPNAPRLGSTACSIFFFVVTAGYGTGVNYRLCMQ